MRHTLRRGGIVTTAVAGFMALSMTAALAHECINASRSATGDQKAGTNSQAWSQVVIEDDFHAELPTAEWADCAYAYWLDEDGPVSFTIHVKGANGQDGVVAGRNPNEEHATDGRGIDHLDEGLFALFGEAIGACAPQDA